MNYTLNCEHCDPIIACMTVETVTYRLEPTDTLLLELCGNDAVFSVCEVDLFREVVDLALTPVFLQDKV